MPPIPDRFYKKTATKKSEPFEVLLGDCLEVIPTLQSDSIDAIITDPPYGLKFMGKKWDHGVPGVPFWQVMLRVVKPGTHLLAFGGTRTYHRLACCIEDAGWEIRDCIMWVYGSGFPKSLDVSKAIDAAAGAEREVVGVRRYADGTTGHYADANVYGAVVNGAQKMVTAPATDAAKQWDGWGTALKPAYEPVIVARKPLAGTVAENVLRHGTGGLNINGCRIPADDSLGRLNHSTSTFNHKNTTPWVDNSDGLGRWPSNLIHDGSEEATNPLGKSHRFYYCAKASKKDRGKDNKHPTVKPTALMRYLCRLITPPNGLILDPFCGSGSTGKAAMLERFRFVGIDNDESSVQTAINRITQVIQEVTNATNTKEVPRTA
jgi:DNA modification methylase